MRRLYKWLGRLGLMLVGFIAGCWGGGGYSNLMYGVTPAYGAPSPPPAPHDSSVVLENLDYTPASPVTAGTDILFEAITNKPTSAGTIRVGIGDPPIAAITLQDFGIPPDDVEGDGIWHGEWDMPEIMDAGKYTVVGRLFWADGFTPLETDGEDLIITEPEEAE